MNHAEVGAGLARLLAHLHLGLAQRVAGTESTLYADACAALEGMAEDEAKKGDAGFCLSQLRAVEQRYLP